MKKKSLPSKHSYQTVNWQTLSAELNDQKSSSLMRISSPPMFNFENITVTSGDRIVANDGDE